jgi:hypothetical protein
MENPADCATRGLSPEELKEFQLWWRGESWLIRDRACWPQIDVGPVCQEDPALERKPDQVHSHHAAPVPDFIERFSTYTQTVRVTAYILHFMNNASVTKPRMSGPLSILELDYALKAMVRIVQRQSFPEDITAVKRSKSLPSRSMLVSLTSFLSEVILRVRGRLRHSYLSHERRHPIILPSNHHFTDLVIRHSHYQTLYGGAQLSLAHARQHFWIVTGSQAVRRVLKKCVQCFRLKPTGTTQLMGDLPLHRVSPPNRPFIATGVDYTGAIEVKATRLRGTSFI